MPKISCWAQVSGSPLHQPTLFHLEKVASQRVDLVSVAARRRCAPRTGLPCRSGPRPVLSATRRAARRVSD